MLIFILACDESLDSGQPTEFDPLESATSPGSWNVGHGQVSVDYLDPLGAERSLRTSVWWPTPDTSGFAATYFYGSDESEVAFENATVAEGTFPVVVFSHGHQAFAECSSFLMEHLASHGFVVIAPDHTNNTTLDGADRATEIYIQRPFDLSAVIDALEAGSLPVPANRYDGRLVVTGHSFGGYTVIASGGSQYDTDAITAECTSPSSGICESWSADWVPMFQAGAYDDRVQGVLAMAAGDFDLFGAAGVVEVKVPTLLMTGELDPQHAADGADYWAALSPVGHRYVSIAEAGHNAFTDFSGVFEDGGTIDPAQGFRIVDAYALAFAASATGDGRYEAILDGRIEVDTLATVH